MKNKNLTILVGNIGSGKSTWIEKNRKKEEIVISRDALRYMFGGANYLFTPLTEPLVWNSELWVFKEAVKEGFSIIVDEVGLSRKLRKRYIDLVRNKNYNVIIVEMPKLSMEESVDRRMNNPHQQSRRIIWELVWKKFDLIYEKPIKEEGIDKIIRIKKEKVGSYGRKKL